MEEFIDLVDFGDLFVAYHGQSPAGAYEVGCQRTHT